MWKNKQIKKKWKLSSAIGMIENYCKQKDEAIEKALEVFDQVFDQYVEDGGHFYGHGIYIAIEKLKEAYYADIESKDYN